MVNKHQDWQLLTLIFKYSNKELRFCVSYSHFVSGWLTDRKTGVRGLHAYMRTRLCKENENLESSHWSSASFTRAILSSYNLPPRQLQWAMCDSVSVRYTDQICNNNNGLSSYVEIKKKDTKYFKWVCYQCPSPWIRMHGGNDVAIPSAMAPIKAVSTLTAKVYMGKDGATRIVGHSCTKLMFTAKTKSVP